MRFGIVCEEGIEDTASKELEELGITPEEQERNLVVFETEFEDAVRVCYRTRSALRVLLLLSEETVESLDDLSLFKESLEDLSKNAVKKKTTFRASAGTKEEEGTKREFTKTEVEGRTGALVKETLDLEVDLDQPDVVFYTFINKENKGFFGISLSKTRLDKREYKVFNSRTSLKGTTAYALLKEGGYERGEVVVDPFARDGTVPIEGAVYNKKKPTGRNRRGDYSLKHLSFFNDWKEVFDKEDRKEEKMEKKINNSTDKKIYCFDKEFNHVRMSEKNAKIEGVNDMIKISRNSIDWLDVEFRKGEVDLVATQPPVTSKNSSDKEVRRKQQELFYQSEYVLKQGGRLALLTTKFEEFEEFRKKYNFSVEQKKKIMMGKRESNIVVYKSIKENDKKKNSNL